MNILQISTADSMGGAERVALNLHRQFLEKGHHAMLAVGRKHTDDPSVARIANHDVGNPWSRAMWRAHAKLQPLAHRKTVRRIAGLVEHLAQPRGYIDDLMGRENFHYPGAWRVADDCPHVPEIVHAHNLHGRYFDLHALTRLSRLAPTILTLHDQWLLTGHCAHSLDCERWKLGCGHCPDLSIYPAVRRDATAFNHRRKLAILSASGVHVAVPCRWLERKVRESALAPHLRDVRVIPNGVDQAVFKPADQMAARKRLGLPLDADILLFSAFGVTKNPWKDFDTLRKAAGLLGKRRPKTRLLFLLLGERGDSETIGHAELRFAAFVNDLPTVAAYYQAADLYLHAAKADTFPNSILEALACGTPVVATAVGGIPEQIDCLHDARCNVSTVRPNGVLVPPSDPAAMADAVEMLLSNRGLRAALSTAAAQAAQQRFSLLRQVDDYLQWYGELTGAGKVRSAADLRRSIAQSTRAPSGAVLAGTASSGSHTRPFLNR